MSTAREEETIHSARNCSRQNRRQFESRRQNNRRETCECGLILFFLRQRYFHRKRRWKIGRAICWSSCRFRNNEQKPNKKMVALSVGDDVVDDSRRFFQKNEERKKQRYALKSKRTASDGRTLKFKTTKRESLSLSIRHAWTQVDWSSAERSGEINVKAKRSYVLKRMPPNSFSVLGTRMGSSHCRVSDDLIVGVVLITPSLKIRKTAAHLAKHRKYEAAFPNRRRTMKAYTRRE